MPSTNRIRTRFAPSPTGFLHIGGLRTALYAFLFAKQHGGDFLLRIEDTDQSRKVEGAVENLITSLERFDIIPDEGPRLSEDGVVYETGEYGPYHQSHRLEIYREHAQQLLDAGHAYYSFATSEDLDAIRKRLDKEHRPLKRADLNENYSNEEVQAKIAAGEPYVIRLAIPSEGNVILHDAVRGDVTFNYAQVDDQVLMKSDGFPTYHLAAVVDDHLMEISHVIRGEEWLSSSPKHLFLYEAFGWEPPVFAHIPLILNPDKTKLSKRQGDVAVENYLEQGYMPQALVNFVALLGWNPGEGSTEEFFTLDDLIKQFSLERVNKAGAVFDREKLDWMNGKYLREKIGIEAFLNLIVEQLSQFLQQHRCGAQYLEDPERLRYFAHLIRERVTRLDQVSEWFAENTWIDEPATYESSKLVWKKSTPEQTADILAALLSFIQSLPETDFNAVDKLESVIKAWIAENGYGVGDVLWPMRVALTGLDRSPNPFEIAYLIKQEPTVQRIQAAVNALAA